MDDPARTETPGPPEGIRAVYRRLLRVRPGFPLQRTGASYTVHWAESPAPDPEEILAAVEAGLRSPGRVYSRGPATSVFRTEVADRPVVVKRFHLPGLGRRLQYLARPSRARRAWAAGRALREAGIPAPAALGFVEVRARGLPLTSLAVAEWMEGAVPVRRWIKAWLHQRPPEVRAAFRGDLAGLLLDLYRRRLYHADTKTSNLLVRHPDDPARRAFFWIELESMAFGVVPTRRRILRNLVQLNGSIGAKLTDEDRLAFLQDLSGFAPWVIEPWVADQIRVRTLERLNRERRGECGP